MRLKSNIQLIYGGFFSFGGGAKGAIAKLSDCFTKIGHPNSIFSLENLPIYKRYNAHLVKFILNNRLLSPLDIIYKTKIHDRYFHQYLDHSSYHIYNDVFFSRRQSQKELFILHALWSDNLQGKEISPRFLDKLLAFEAQKLTEKSGLIVTVSKEYKEAVLNKLAPFWTNPPEIKVLPLGIDFSKLPDRLSPPKTQPHKICICGYLEARKNFSFIAEVLKELKDKNFKSQLNVIGKGPLEDTLKSEFEAASEGFHKIEFHGWLPPHEVWDQMSQNDILLHPSLKESFSYTLLEARAIGLTTISTPGLEVPDDFITHRTQLDAKTWSNLIINSENSNHLEFKSCLQKKYDIVNYAQGILDLLNYR